MEKGEYRDFEWIGRLWLSHTAVTTRGVMTRTLAMTRALPTTTVIESVINLPLHLSLLRPHLACPYLHPRTGQMGSRRHHLRRLFRQKSICRYVCTLVEDGQLPIFKKHFSSTCSLLTFFGFCAALTEFSSF